MLPAGEMWSIVTLSAKIASGGGDDVVDRRVVLNVIPSVGGWRHRSIPGSISSRGLALDLDSPTSSPVDEDVRMACPEHVGGDVFH
jgi:hypothetical protein